MIREKSSNNAHFLSAAFHGLVILFLSIAWCEVLLSVHNIYVDKRQLYTCLFICVLLCGTAVKKGSSKYLVPVLLFAVAAIAWENWEVVQKAINHIGNTWLRLKPNESDSRLFYDDEGLTVTQMSLCFAGAMLPLILIWTAVLKRQKGKAAAVLLMLVPVVVIAVEGYFPSASSCWMLVLSGAVYFSSSGEGSFKAIWRKGMLSTAVFAVLIVVSVSFGSRIEEAKISRLSEYLQVRTDLNKNLIQRVTSREKQKSSEKARTERKNDQQNRELEETPEQTERTQDLGGIFTDQSLTNLKDVSEYAPQRSSAGQVVVQQEKPEQTVYVGNQYGGIYSSSGWEIGEQEGGDMWEYQRFPDSLTRLAQLCGEQNILSLSEAEAFIRREFEQNTVYDYRPGKTPENQDFAEYFLFDNKKGFCVHFATTAVLMYRMWGFTARYVEGYAVPPSAFVKQGNGTYQAQITQDMGHAWCEIYEDGWKIKEHTLAYSGPDSPSSSPAADSGEHKEKRQSRKIKGNERIWVAGFAAVSALLFAIFWGQAALRKKRKHCAFKSLKNNRGFHRIYQNIYDIGIFQGMNKLEPLSLACFKELKARYSVVSSYEWEWVEEAVLSSVFHNAVISVEDRDRLYEIYKRISDSAQKGVKGLRKIAYRYLNCLD